MRTESEFLTDVLSRLGSAGVDYMLTGSMASNYWGIPRTTHDLDFVLVLRPSQVDRFVAAFDAGFFYSAGIGSRGFSTSDETAASVLATTEDWPGAPAKAPVVSQWVPFGKNCGRRAFLDLRALRDYPNRSISPREWD